MIMTLVDIGVYGIEYDWRVIKNTFNNTTSQ